ncbi:hypothetical protein As57867_022405, partial [Aphanomyces stellatus]
LEHSVIQRALLARMDELAGQDDPNPLRVLSPAEVRNFEGPGEEYRMGTVHLEDGRQIRSRLVVAGDGGKSMIRSLSGLGTWGWSYDQQAVVATVKTDEIHTTAWQRFLPTGPIALLPIRDGYSSIVWSTTEAHAMELKGISPDEFVAQLNETLSPRRPVPSAPQGHGAVGRRVSFQLKLQHATRYAKSGVALVGDSTHSIHPLAGQGLSLGLGRCHVPRAPLGRRRPWRRPFGRPNLFAKLRKRPKEG